MEQLSKDYDLEFTRLSNDEFVSVLEQILQNFLHVLPEYCTFILYLSESAYEEREHVAAQEIPVQITQFAHLEDPLTTIWGGISGKQKLLFPGAEIKFHTKNEALLRFIIEMSGISTHPILFEEEILLGIGEGDITNQKVRILTIGKDGSVKHCPVLSGEQLTLQVGNSRKL